jgi:Ca-activated chloride channel homolog
MFEWWPALIALALLPLAAFGYARMIARSNSESLVVHSDAGLLERAAQRTPSWTRHLGAVLFGVGVTTGIFALARPHATVPVPDDRTRVMLALDVSRSMMAQDVLPTRFDAAKSALKTFIKSLPAGSVVGLVTFARYATLNQAPSDNHETLLEIVDTLDLDFGTVIGDGLKLSLEALPSNDLATTGNRTSLDPEVVVLLSDGRNFGGSDPLQMAQRAKNRKVKVYTVGVGTVTDGPIPGLPPSVWPYARFDEETLKGIAQRADGQYFFVDDARKLEGVYRNLARSIGFRMDRTEISSLVALVAALFLVTGVTVNLTMRRVV